MNIKAVGRRVLKLLCGPNQTHPSVLSVQEAGRHLERSWWSQGQELLYMTI